MIEKNRLFDRVSSVCPMERSIFEEDFEQTVKELCAMFGKKYVLCTNETGIEEEASVREEYTGAICSAILFFHNGEQEDRERFLERSGRAFLEVWRQRCDRNRKGAGA